MTAKLTLTQEAPKKASKPKPLSNNTLNFLPEGKNFDSATADSYELIFITDIAPRPFNARNLFDAEKLEELAQDIRKRGIAQPLRLRPTSGGKTKYEIVAGERRFRAAIMAKLTVVPAVIREMSDIEADEMMIVENAQREDLTIIEECDGYRRLFDEHGLTVTEIAERVKKSRREVIDRLILKSLTPTTRAFFNQKTPPMAIGAAKLCAQISDDKLQDLYFHDITHEFNQGLQFMSYKKAQDCLERYLIKLERAQFLRTDPQLHALAGSCTACQFNTTNFEPELGLEKEKCTKPSCFALKQSLAYTQIKKAEKEKGAMILEGEKLKELFDRNGNINYASGFIDIDSMCYETNKKSDTWRKLLRAENWPQLYLAFAPNARISYLFKREAAHQAIGKQEGKRPSQGSFTTPEQREAEKKKKRMREALRRSVTELMPKLVEHTAKLKKDEAIAFMVHTVLASKMHYYSTALLPIAKRREIQLPEKKNKEYEYGYQTRCAKFIMDEYVPTLKLPELMVFLMEFLIVSDSVPAAGEKPGDTFAKAVAMAKLDFNEAQTRHFTALYAKDKERERQQKAAAQKQKQKPEKSKTASKNATRKASKRGTANPGNYK